MAAPTPKLIPPLGVCWISPPPALPGCSGAYVPDPAGDGKGAAVERLQARGSSAGRSLEWTVRDYENRIEAAHSCFERCRRSNRFRSRRSGRRTRVPHRSAGLSTLFLSGFALWRRRAALPAIQLRQLRAAAVSAATIRLRATAIPAAAGSGATLPARTLRNAVSRSATVPASRPVAGSQRRPA